LLKNQDKTELIEYSIESFLGGSVGTSLVDSDRKTVVLQMEEDIFLISAIIPEQTSKLMNQSYVNIYHLDDEDSYSPSLVLTLDASSFNAEQITIEDIAIDANNNIFLVDGQLGLRTFEYLKSNRIVKGPSYLASGSRYWKVVVFAQNRNRTIVLLVDEKEIKEFEYNGKTLTLTRNYGLPEELVWEKEYQIDLNDRYFAIKTDEATYVYEIGTVSSSELFASLPNTANSFIWMSQTRDSLITLDNEGIKLHSIQRSALLLKEIS